MKGYSKPDTDTAFRKTFLRDVAILLSIAAITAIGIVLTLYAAAKGIID